MLLNDRNKSETYEHRRPRSYPYAKERFLLLIFVLILLASVLVWRMIDLTVYDRNFLEKQGNARSLRVIDIPAYRGMITDRHGAPLAVSTLVEAVWINPKESDINNALLPELAKNLDIPLPILKDKMNLKTREFIYLKRGLDPTIAENIRTLKIPGVHLQKEFKRYYPDGEVTAQLVGFTNIDDQGQEGLELAYNGWLKGEPGQKRVLKDLLGHAIADVQHIRDPKPGKNLALSIDRRIQYAAYRELKKAVAKLKAKSGSAVVLDSRTGEVLAMVNQPSYNPNNRSEISAARIRNRALTDTFEPGSVMKAFSVASAVDSGQYNAQTMVDIGKGWMSVGRHGVTDEHSSGLLSVTEILQKSSNVGVTKMTLSLPPDQLPRFLRRTGFGESTNTGFPGESAGFLPAPPVWKPFALATLAFGYGLSVTPAQLARGYSIFANQGKLLPISLLLNTRPSQQGVQVMNPQAANEILLMLEAVVEGGTGSSAKVTGYRVAGKTGTARIAGKAGYEKNRHIATFAGIAPVSNPRLIVIVMVNDPKLGGLSYYATTATAPVFSRIMEASLRILDVPPDALSAPSPLFIKEDNHL